MHQIGREKRTTISEVIVRGKRNIQQNRNWFYFKFSFESSSFLIQTSLSFVWFYQCLSVKICLPSLLFRCFPLFMPHLRILAQEKRSQNCLRFGTLWGGGGGGGESLLVPIIVAKYNIFPRANNGRSREKKNFWRSDLLMLSACTISGFRVRLRVLNLIARLC